MIAAAIQGRALDWRHDTSPFDDWLDEVYLVIMARSRGSIRRDDLDAMPVHEVLMLAEIMIDAERETTEAIAAMLGAMPR